MLILVNTSFTFRLARREPCPRTRQSLGKRTVQRIASALAFEAGDELLLFLPKAAQDGIGDLAVHLDVPFPGEPPPTI